MHILIQLQAIILQLFILTLMSDCYHGDADTLSDAYHIQSLSGEVDAGNFSYYKLSSEGNIYLKLVSTEGDADLYASTQTLTPTPRHPPKHTRQRQQSTKPYKPHRCYVMICYVMVCCVIPWYGMLGYAML